MALIGLNNPFNMTEAVVSFGLNDYQKVVSSVRIENSPNSADFRGVGGNVETLPGKGTWTLVLTFAQDWETVDSLSLLLWNNDGEKTSVSVEPVAGGAHWEGEVTLVAPSVGGDVDVFATSSVTLTFTEKPELIAA